MWRTLSQYDPGGGWRRTLRGARLLVGSIAAVGVFALSCEGAPIGPNVLILMWDTARADRSSAYGNTARTTPRLEEFAAEGVLYTNAISPAIRSSPAHASIFTGLPVSVHGVIPGQERLDDSFETLAESFRAAGYRTYAASANPRISELTNLVQGFDRVQLTWEEPLANATQRNASSKLIKGDRGTELSLSQGREGGVADWFKEAGPALNQALLDWVDDGRRSRPFFAFVNYMEVHLPRIPSEATRRRFLSPEEYERAMTLNRKRKRQIAYSLRQAEYSEQDFQLIRRLYDAALYELDAVTGELLDALRERQLLDETIVVIVSDHGESLGEHHVYGHRFAIHDPLTRVPLAIRYPPALAPARVEALVNTLDLHATLLDLAGVPGPKSTAKVLPTAPGQPATRKAVVTEAHESGIPLLDNPEWSGIDGTPYLRDFVALYAGGLKLVRADDDPPVLYELAGDPSEQRDFTAFLPEDASRLSGWLDTWRAEHRAARDDMQLTPGRAELTPEMAERLRALGYIEDDQAR